MTAGKKLQVQAANSTHCLALGDQIIGEMSVRQNSTMSKPDGFA
jgi:hypothetical protein